MIQGILRAVNAAAPASPAMARAPVGALESGDRPTLAELPLRERKKRACHARIHAAAVELALERGADNVTVEEIANAAGISPRTFFNYFPTRLDALVGHDPELIERAAGSLLARPEGESLIVALRAVVRAHLASVTADDRVWRLRRQLADRTPELSARLAGAGHRFEEALVAAAYERTGTDPAQDIATAMAARTSMAALRSAFAQHRAAHLEGSVLARLDAAFDVAFGTAFDAVN